jgi:chemotaxis protein methyltransferase CheR
MTRYEIGIVETRNVIKAILDTYGYDFRDYALTSFKRRLEDIITKNGLKDAEGLVYRLQMNKEFFEIFLKEVNPETTEMFRDPSLWRTLREEIIPELAKSNSKVKIWLASFDSGEELFSLCILLKELELLENFQIYASILSDENLKKIKSGRIDSKQIEVNEANFERSNCIGKYSNYYTTSQANGIITIDPSLVQDVVFIKQDTLFNNAPSAIRLALFRNQIIYFNQILQDKILNSIHNSIIPGGYLILGAKETLENSNSTNKFTITNESEKIYKKKLG